MSRRYINVFSSIYSRVVLTAALSVVEEAFMCQQKLLIELQPVLVDMPTAFLAPLGLPYYPA